MQFFVAGITKNLTPAPGEIKVKFQIRVNVIRWMMRR
jgi:hypothetical protein